MRDDVWVTYLDRAETKVSPRFGPLTVGFGSPKRVRTDDGKREMVPGIGPELGIGWVLGEHFDEPLLLIKAAWGGRALKHTFRPPSAPPDDTEVDELLARIKRKKPEATFQSVRESYGSDYRRILAETHRVLENIDKYVPGYDEDRGYELAGMIWFQGWNDGVGKGNPSYTEQLAQFIRDIRRDLNQPKLRFVIGGLGIDGTEASGWVARFRQQQAAVATMPEFEDSVRLAKTAAYWHTGPTSMQGKWQEFRAAAKLNEEKPLDDPTRIDPGDFFQKHWQQKYKKELAYTSDKRYHYHGSGRCYYEMGESMGRAMLELFPRPR